MAETSSKYPSAIPSPPNVTSPKHTFPPPPSPHRRVTDPEAKLKSEIENSAKIKKEFKELKDANKHLRREIYREQQRVKTLKGRLAWFQEWHRVEKEKEKVARALFRSDSKPYYNELAPDELLVEGNPLDEKTRKPLSFKKTVQQTVLILARISRSINKNISRKEI